MNRDGYRSGRLTAEHESAHALVAILSGYAVGQITIAPPVAIRDRVAGWIAPQGRRVIRHTAGEAPVLAPLTTTAEVDMLAAGYAWETMLMPDDCERALRGADTDLRIWLNHGGKDMPIIECFEAFDVAADRVRGWLAEPDVSAAVRETADRLQAGKSGTIWGTTVEKIALRHGLRPAAVLP